MYKTIWASNQPIRNGLREFFDRYDGRTFVVATDDPDEEAVIQLLDELGIKDDIKEVYTENDMIEVNGKYNVGKDLTKICAEYNVPKDSTVFIGDGDRDRIDARREGIRFVHVPIYESRDENFTFDLVNLDKLPSKYKDLRAVNS
jgi:phosphoglycolate phosphatase-like HAD superfamily hydrolase